MLYYLSYACFGMIHFTFGLALSASSSHEGRLVVVLNRSVASAIMRAVAVDYIYGACAQAYSVLALRRIQCLNPVFACLRSARERWFDVVQRLQSFANLN